MDTAASQAFAAGWTVGWPSTAFRSGPAIVIPASDDLDQLLIVVAENPVDEPMLARNPA
jgi:hypothetical protein